MRQYKRGDFTGWTVFLFGCIWIEAVYLKGRLITLALNWKSRAGGTWRPLDKKFC
jgi:hypothetical protein